MRGGREGGREEGREEEGREEGVREGAGGVKEGGWRVGLDRICFFLKPILLFFFAQ